MALTTENFGLKSEVLFSSSQSWRVFYESSIRSLGFDFHSASATSELYFQVGILIKNRFAKTSKGLTARIVSNGGRTRWEPSANSNDAKSVECGASPGDSDSVSSTY
ncbi:hypothetical protein JTB14_017378 [Gonioctena quinquepunctata]|nr:hypothetical protein JTB14_017378 [Gonioctena quinquepunctata]